MKNTSDVLLKKQGDTLPWVYPREWLMYTNKEFGIQENNLWLALVSGQRTLVLGVGRNLASLQFLYWLVLALKAGEWSPTPLYLQNWSYTDFIFILLNLKSV